MNNKLKDILILSSFAFSFFLALGYLITFFFAYTNGIFYGVYQTVFDVNNFGEATAEAIMFGLVFIVMMVGFNLYMTEFTAKHIPTKERRLLHSYGQVTFWTTVIVMSTVGIILLFLSFANR